MTIWLLRKEVWRTLVISVRRFPRDKRARRVVFVSVALLLYVGCYIRIFFVPFFQTHTNDSQADRMIQLAIAGSLLLGATAIYLLRWWLERRDRISSLLGDTAISAAAAIDYELAEQVWRDTSILAALLQRSGSESAMQTTKVAPGKEIITRQWQRERLLALRLWADLPPAVRDLLLLPDGHWTKAQREAAARKYEHFFALRWALAFDEKLRPLDREPSYAGTAVVSLLRESKPKNLGLRPSWDLRAARDEAYCYFDRFWLEAVARRLIGHQLDEEVQAEATRLKAEIDESAGSTDLWVGAQTVSELADATLMRMTLTSYHRWELLKQLTDIATGESSVGELRVPLFHSLDENQAEVLEAS